MKKIGIITIYDNSNFGNRLQNYATQETIKKFNMEPITLKNLRRCNEKTSKKSEILKQKIIYIIKRMQNILKKTKKEKIFEKFNKRYINFSKNYITGYNAKKIEKEYDYFITGSDQVWNPVFKRMTYIDLLGFTSSNKKISFSASFGISELTSHEQEEKIKEYINDYKGISVRENEGKTIIEKLSDRNDVQVLLDPTMLLTNNEWNKIIKKPQKLKEEKYILLYFLGPIAEEWKIEINRISKEYNCDIINILDPSSEFYNIGPDEFLYLEKNAFFICTDSFHSSVFAILYNKPFIVFERIIAKKNINSRINTLLKKFRLENRRFNGKISEQLLNVNYEYCEEILEDERKKSIEFLKLAFDKGE